jgi:hypothetical protein
MKFVSLKLSRKSLKHYCPLSLLSCIRQLQLNRLHGITSQKMIFFITTAVKTSNPTLLSFTFIGVTVTACQEGGLFICLRKYLPIQFQHALMYSVWNVCSDCLDLYILFDKSPIWCQVPLQCLFLKYEYKPQSLTLKTEVLCVHYKDRPRNNHCLFWELYKTHE